MIGSCQFRHEGEKISTCQLLILLRLHIVQVERPWCALVWSVCGRLFSLDMRLGAHWHAWDELHMAAVILNKSTYRILRSCACTIGGHVMGMFVTTKINYSTCIQLLFHFKT